MTTQRAEPPVWTSRALALLIGAASLAAQVAGSRLASAVVGGTFASSAITLSGAMIGLSAGALLAGAAIGRWNARTLLRGSLLGCAVMLATLHWLILEIGKAEGAPLLRWTLAASLLAIGQLPFGAALPCLTAWRAPAAAGAELYALGALGAVAGALGVGEFLAPHLGFDQIGLLLGGVVLLSVALPGPSRPAEPAQSEGSATLSRRVSVIAFGIGFLGLAAEYLWLRVLGFAWEANAATLALVTASQVAGLSLGSWVASRIVHRSGVVFGLGLSAITLAGAAALASEATCAAGPGERLAISLALVGIPAACFGATFVFLLGGIQGRPPGRALGLLSAINSAGSAAGPILLWAAAPRMAWPPQMLIFVACGYSGLMAVAAAPRSRGLWTSAVLTAVLALGGWGLAPAAPDPTNYASAGEIETTSLPFVRSGLGSTVVVTRDTQSGVDLLWIDRSLQGDTSALGRRIPRLLGRLPCELLGRPARRAMVLGLGTGVTLAGMLEGGAREVDVAELSSGVIEADRTILAEANEHALERKEVRLRPGDGRTLLLDAAAPYDLIVTDMVFPSAVGAGNLFSREFYALARRRLGPDGLFVHWVPCSQLSPEDLSAVFSAFLEAFPEGSAWIGFLGPRRMILGLAGGSISGSLPEPAAFRLALGTAELRAWARGAAPIRDADPRLEFRSPPRADAFYGVENLRNLMGRNGLRREWRQFGEAGLAELRVEEELPGSPERRGAQDQARRLYREAAAAGLADAEFSLKNFEYERQLEAARDAADLSDGDTLLAILKRAAAHPLYGLGNLYLADALAAEGRTEEAVAELEKAVAKSPRSAEARFRLAVMACRVRDYARARRAFEAAQSLRPDAPASYKELARWIGGGGG
jgi:spermidine synthase